MKNFRVYYMKPEWVRDGICGEKPSLNTLTNTHQLLTITRAKDLEDLFHYMQGENWSPNGEARELIDSLNLSHTSMSVGDLAVDENNTVWWCASIGWERLGNLE